MALEGGGFADKFGNSYEALWVAEQLLKLAEEEIATVTIEPLGKDEVGVDLIIQTIDGHREFHQCKSSNSDADVWTLSRLDQAGVLKKLFIKLKEIDVLLRLSLLCLSHSCLI